VCYCLEVHGSFMQPVTIAAGIFFLGISLVVLVNLRSSSPAFRSAGDLREICRRTVIVAPKMLCGTLLPAVNLLAQEAIMTSGTSSLPHFTR
jgi:hypothetical protein